jgi:hypothetical protein
MKPTTRRRLLTLTFLTLAAVGGVLVWRVERQRRLDNALAAAVVRMDVAEVKEALRQGADVNVRIAEGGKDARSGFRFWRDLLSGRRAQGKVALGYVTSPYIEGRMRIVRTLVEAGADPNTRGFRKATPLMAAVSVADEEVMTFLLKSGATLNLKDEDGLTALHYAVQGVRDAGATVVAMLLDAGSDVNAVDYADATPLLLAVLNQSDSAVELLLKHGADPSVEYEGLTVLKIARLNLPNERLKRVVSLLKAAETEWRAASSRNAVAP